MTARALVRRLVEAVPVGETLLDVSPWLRDKEPAGERFFSALLGVLTVEADVEELSDDRYIHRIYTLAGGAQVEYLRSIRDGGGHLRRIR